MHGILQRRLNKKTHPAFTTTVDYQLIIYHVVLVNYYDYYQGWFLAINNHSYFEYFLVEIDG